MERPAACRLTPRRRAGSGCFCGPAHSNPRRTKGNSGTVAFADRCPCPSAKIDRCEDPQKQPRAFAQPASTQRSAFAAQELPSRRGQSERRHSRTKCCRLRTYRNWPPRPVPQLCSATCSGILWRVLLRWQHRDRAEAEVRTKTSRSYCPSSQSCRHPPDV